VEIWTWEWIEMDLLPNSDQDLSSNYQCPNNWFINTHWNLNIHWITNAIGFGWTVMLMIVIKVFLRFSLDPSGLMCTTKRFAIQ